MLLGVLHPISRCREARWKCGCETVLREVETEAQQRWVAAPCPTEPRLHPNFKEVAAPPCRLRMTQAAVWPSSVPSPSLQACKWHRSGFALPFQVFRHGTCMPQTQDRRSCLACTVTRCARNRQRTLRLRHVPALPFTSIEAITRSFVESLLSQGQRHSPHTAQTLWLSCHVSYQRDDSSLVTSVEGSTTAVR